MLTIDEVKKLSTLARIELSDAELQKFQKEISLVLDYVTELGQVDTTGLEIVTQVTGLENVMRADEVQRLALPEDVLAQAPATSVGYVKVKAIL